MIHFIVYIQILVDTQSTIMCFSEKLSKVNFNTHDFENDELMTQFSKY